MAVALLSILVYDHCLTFDTEVQRIWTLRWKLPKYLFILTRYLLPPVLFFEGFSNLVVDASMKICNAKKFTSIPTFLSIMTVELMLILRVLALYENSKFMARLLAAIYSVQMLSWTVICTMILVNIRGIPGGNLYSGCLYETPRYAYVGYVPGLVFECLLIVLTMYKARKLGKFSPTLQILVRDSIIYFVSMTAVLAFNTFYLRFGHHLLGPSLILPSSVVTSISAARLTMNIRAITMDDGIEALAQHNGVSRRQGVDTVSTFRLRDETDRDFELVHKSGLGESVDTATDVPNQRQKGRTDV
ncbi:hypothetical protein B0H34DRAFT_692088 [Crassisporium funariophilum]|nr:hypothetical protein B0H34DRAFT_692088 [Crassisporium funariophilum]